MGGAVHASHRARLSVTCAIASAIYLAADATTDCEAVDNAPSPSRKAAATASLTVQVAGSLAREATRAIADAEAAEVNARRVEQRRQLDRLIELVVPALTDAGREIAAALLDDGMPLTDAVSTARAIIGA